jgi:hypothetical protein
MFSLAPCSSTSSTLKPIQKESSCFERDRQVKCLEPLTNSWDCRDDFAKFQFVPGLRGGRVFWQMVTDP